jgi:hypothetical protein
MIVSGMVVVAVSAFLWARSKSREVVPVKVSVRKS